MRNLKFIALGLAGLLTFGVAFVQLYVWITMYGVVNSISNEIAELDKRGKANSEFSPNLEITGIEEGGQQKFGYVALTSIGKMHDYRFVNIDGYVRLEDMLEAGEQVPETEMLSAFVQARVVRLADAECEILEKTLAADCSVSAARASASPNGLVNTSISLNFVQKSEFGTINAEKKAAYVEIEQNLTSGDATEIISLSEAASLRSSLYERAVSFCDKIRSSEGNCAISNVFI